MRLRHSLRFRIVTTFAVAGFLMGLVFGGVVCGFLHTMEDDILEGQLEVEGQAFVSRYRQSGDAVLPRTSTIRGFIGLEGIEGELRRWVNDLSPGTYEHTFKDYHVFISDLPGTDEFLYLFYFVKEVEPLEPVPLDEILALGCLLVTLLSGWFGWGIANRMIAPVMRLSEMVTKSQPDGVPHSLEGHFYDDEVGRLAQDFQASMARVKAFVARERRFTRDTSHEFRTPVTVIKGAAELLTRKVADQPGTKALRRIQRAVLDLENIIETFLYLGREESLPQAEATHDLNPIIENAIQQNRYLLEGRNVSVMFDPQEPPWVRAPKAVIAIAIGNLIRNSFQFTVEGSVRVVLRSGEFQITDTGRGIAPEALSRITSREVKFNSNQGFGLGLSIVNDFCLKYGWTLHIDSQLAEGTQMTLRFGKGANGPEKANRAPESPGIE